MPSRPHFREASVISSPKVFLVLLVACSAARAQDKTPSPPAGSIEYLWPQTAPGAVGAEEQDKPSMLVYLTPAAAANGAAVVVCPGGGYGSLAIEQEGQPAAQWLNQRGVSAFVLQYRIAPRYHYPAPMLDVQRAIRTVRSQAAAYKIDPARIGIWGFSAGGHLASWAATHFDDGQPKAVNPIERVSCRPDFAILTYPVIVFGKPYTHLGSMMNLLGDRVNHPQLVEELSTEKHVTQKTPPCFLIHTSSDTHVPAENSIDFYLALRQAGVPAELHIYEQGGHAFGLGGTDPVLSTWPDRLAAWMGKRGLLVRQ
jgi:acetyl esterase/lipase